MGCTHPTLAASDHPPTGQNHCAEDLAGMGHFTRSFLVHWNDCDPAGIVFHAYYIRWMRDSPT
jgi:hypothetical protein